MTSLASPTIGTSAVRILRDLGRVDVDVHDLGVRREQRRLAGDAVVEPGAERDDAGRSPAARAPREPCRACPACRGAAWCESGNAPRAISVVTTGAPVASASVEQLGRRLGADHAAADVEHGLLGLGEQLGRGLDLLAVRLGDRAVAGQVDLRRPDERRLVLLGVLRDVDEHGAGATGRGDLVRRGDRRRGCPRRASPGRSAW